MPCASVPWLTSLLYHFVGHRYLAALLLQCVIGALIPLQLVTLGRQIDDAIGAGTHDHDSKRGEF